jgi:CheY-like chemotaxis protein
MMHILSKQAAHDVFYQKLSRFLHYYEASHLACGMIFSLCERLGERELEGLKAQIAQLDQQVAAQYFYDQATGLLVILLDDQRLAFTHFLALGVKQFLREQNLLRSDILLASYPENAASAEQLLLGMRRELLEKPGEGDELRIYHPALSTDKPDCVLVIDSDETVCELLSARLGAKGYEVHVAHDGMDGIRKFEELSPKIIITELSLPVLDGYQLIKSIGKRKPRRGDCNIIVLTDRRLEEDISKCFEQGVADYMTKPFSPVELEVRMKRFLA